MKVTPGTKYGMLTAIELVGYYSHPAAGRTPVWRWKCDCGKETTVRANNVVNGHTKSCGCLSALTLKAQQEKNRTHGDGATGEEHPLFKVWKGIKRRCGHRNYPEFHLYGGRGIHVLWPSYEAFKRDMADGYRPGLQIDRIDNNGNYCKENCRWVNRVQQANNRRTNRFVTFEGQTHTLAEWARKTGIPSRIIRDRLNDGWTLGKIMRCRVMAREGKKE